MILPIVQYGHPVLRQKGAEIQEITPAIRQLARDMIETMHDANGVGLAAQQVGEALQLTVLDVRGADRSSQLFIGVQEVPLDARMPMVLLNPKILKREGEELGVEGCLSFPEMSADILRASTVQVSAKSLDGVPIQFTATGLLGRAVQHELDHLNGVLFIDRMAPEALEKLRSKVDALEKQTVEMLKKQTKKKKGFFR
jgi:peptide deformylase